jgi:hypothetical protein
MYRRSEKIAYRASCRDAFRRKFCERVFQQPQAITPTTAASPAWPAAGF